MNHLSTRLATDWSDPPARPALWQRLLKQALPAANPDFEQLIPRVRCWWLEVDETGMPQREIGFDSEGAVLFAAPFDHNMGFWTDSDMTFLPADNEPVSADDFETTWSDFVGRWNPLR